MSTKSVAQKLLLKSGHVFVLIDPPPGYRDHLGALPDGLIIQNHPSNPADVIQVFVTSQGRMEKVLSELKTCLKPNGILWVTYPKGTSALASDVNRDTIWRFARTIGMDAVAMFAVDETWSAMRLKLPL